MIAKPNECTCGGIITNLTYMISRGPSLSLISNAFPHKISPKNNSKPGCRLPRIPLLNLKPNFNEGSTIGPLHTGRQPEKLDV